MSGVVVLTCNARGAECQQLRAVENAKSLSAARARAAVYGWRTWQPHGTTLDACPACARAALLLQPAATTAPVDVTTDRLVAVLIDEAARERSVLPAQAGPPAAPMTRHAAQLLPEGLDVCDACADGEHRRCRGCACTHVDHEAHAPMPVRAPAGL